MAQRGGILSTATLLKRRRTKIVATVGPASADPSVVAHLIDAGVDLFRLNMSHGNHDRHAAAYATIRSAAKAAGQAVGVLADLSGPKMRVGRFDGGSVDLAEGERVTITTRSVAGGPALIPSQYEGLAADVRPGCRIMLDDGFMELRVDDVVSTEVTCTVVSGGRLTDRKGINLPDVQMSAASFGAKDRDDASFALGLGVDYLALSFVRRALEVDELRAFIPAGRHVGIIAKIERPEALDDIDAIVESADAIMVARGDLGVELEPERVPVLQRELVARARARAKPSIVATQMLESMIDHPRPTRAEASDVATAVFDGADAVMLSAETATGHYPVRAVEMMDRIVRQVEGHLWTENGFQVKTNVGALAQPVHNALARSTAQLSRDLSVRAIAVFSTSGTTAGVVSSARPAAPIVAITTTPHLAAQMSLLWGTVPRSVADSELVDAHGLVRRLVTDLGLARPGQAILAVADFGEHLEDHTPTITLLAV